MAKKIQDFGQKIGGARKDFYVRGLNLSDVDDLNTAERIKNIKKDNIWPRYKPEQEIAAGIPQGIMYWRNEMRKAFPPTPSSFTDDDIVRNYVVILGDVADMVNSVTNEAEMIECQKEIRNRYFVSTGYYRVAPVPEAKGVVDGKVLKGTQFKYSEMCAQARTKLYGIPKDKKLETAMRQSLVILQVGENVFPEKNRREQFSVTVKIPGGRMFFYPRDKRIANLDDPEIAAKWEPGRYVILNLQKNSIVEFGLESKEEAEKVVDDLVAMAVAADEKAKAEEPPQKKGKGRFSAPALEYVTRTGPKYLDHAHATPQDFLDLGIRGGEFGNWMNDTDAQGSLDLCYNAFQDLGRILGVEPKDITLNGELSIAFGARGTGGKGAGAAHYEPARQVINLTKHRGVGCLAHEWGHALDDYIGRHCSAKITDHGQLATESFQQFRANENLPKALVNILNAMQYKTATLSPDSPEVIREKDQRLSDAQRRFECSCRIAEPKFKDTLQLKAWQDAISEVYHAGLTHAENPQYMYDSMEQLRTVYRSVAGKGRELPLKLAVAIQSNSELQEDIINSYPTEPITRRVKTDFYKGSKAFDEQYSKMGHGYWSSPCEMFARAFDCYVSDKLKEAGVKSQYLTSHADVYSTVLSDGEKVFAIPRGEERKELNHLFDELVVELKEHGLLHERVSTPEIPEKEKMDVSEHPNVQREPRVATAKPYIPKLKEEENHQIAFDFGDFR